MPNGACSVCVCVYVCIRCVQTPTHGSEVYTRLYRHVWWQKACLHLQPRFLYTSTSRQIRISSMYKKTKQKKDFVPLQLSLTQQINQRKVIFCVFLLLYFWPFMCSKVPYAQHQTHTDSKPVIHAYKFLHRYFYQYSSVKSNRWFIWQCQLANCAHLIKIVFVWYHS